MLQLITSSTTVRANWVQCVQWQNALCSLCTTWQTLDDRRTQIWIRHVIFIRTTLATCKSTNTCVTVLMQIALCRMRIARKMQNFPLGLFSLDATLLRWSMRQYIVLTTHESGILRILILLRLARSLSLWPNCAEQSLIHVELAVVCPK